MNLVTILDALTLSSIHLLGYLAASVIKERNICSEVSFDSYYKNLTSNILNVWHKFVPHLDKIKSSNCWYASNFKSLPLNLTLKVRDVYSFASIQNQFNKHEVQAILKNILGNDNSAIFSKSPTNYHFCLPSAFLIGFPKCGTTLLYQYIESHPLFAKPHSKEGQFWREIIRTSEIEYMELEILIYLFHFFGASKMIRINPNMFTVDASASTVFAAAHPFRTVEKDICIVPMILFQTLPRSKIIIIMRNPVDRLWSDFWYFCSPSKWKKLGYMSGYIPSVASELFHNYSLLAIKNFNNCINDGYTQFHCATIAGSIPGEEAACKNIRIGLSMYYLHVIRWYDTFPQNQLLLIRIEDLVSDHVKTMDGVWSFLEISSVSKHITNRPNQNLWISTNQHFKMWPDTKNTLRKFFAPYNQLLAELLNDNRFLWLYN